MGGVGLASSSAQPIVNRMRTLLPLLLVVLALAGLVDSFALTGAILFDEGRCLEGAGCQSVLTSKYAQVFGVSWSALGLIHYFVLLALSLLVAFLRHRGALYLTILSSGIGVLVSGYLVYLQGFKINSWCPLCLISAALQVLIFGTASTLRRHLEVPGGKLRPAQAFGVAAFSALALSGIFWGIISVKNQLTDRGISKSEDLFATIEGKKMRISEEEGLRQLRYDIAEFGHTHYKSWYQELLFKRYAEEKGHANRAELVDSRLAKNPITVTDQDIEDFYREEYRSTAGVKLPLEETREDIRAYLDSNRFKEFEANLLEEIEQHYQAEFLLAAPLPPKVEISFSPEETPIFGNPQAPIQIVEFVDFSCPYCRLTQEELRKLKNELGDQVAVSYRHFGPVNQDYATAAALATIAAWKQGKFWPFAFDLFEKQGDGIEKDETYRQLAQKHGLDLAQFDRDRTSPENEKILERDQKLARSVNVPAPPSVFINGHRVTENPTYENMINKIKSLGLLE